MGANTSKSSGKGTKNELRNNQHKIEDLVDLGAVFPNGLYTTAAVKEDFDPRIVRNLIVSRRLSPFYKGLEDAPETVTAPLSETLLSAPLPPLPQSSASLSTISVSSVATSNTSIATTSNTYRKGKVNSTSVVNRPRSASSSKLRETAPYDPYAERKKAHDDKMKQREKMLYNDAVECPICFLFYPANINYSRCCDQPICTECFVQIHRPIETPSIPATCPFCMEENFGILYDIPLWSEKFQARSRSGSHSTMTGTRHTTSGVSGDDGPRREKVSHDSPDVVLIDHIRPNWNDTLAAATTTNPIISRRNSASAGGSRPLHSNPLLRATGLLTRSGRSASSAAATEYNQLFSNMRDLNMDLEDWMVMEAIRQSLVEQEEKEKKEAASNKNKQQKTPNQQNDNEGSSSSNNS